MPVILETRIRPMWSTVRELRKQVGELLREYPEELQHAAQMVASELLENAVKYGESTEGAPNIDFNIEISDRQIAIRVVNGIDDDARLERLKARVQEIATAQDRELPYLRQVESLRDNPGESAGLGIYRIGVEGEFELDCRVDNHVLTVTATRRLR